jgi:Ca-activated chloride channel family protein
MAKLSNGFAMNVSNSDDIVGKLLLTTDKLTHEAFHDIDVRIKGVKVRDMSPERIGSLYRGQQLIVVGHYWGDGEAEVTISGKLSGQDQSYSSRFDFPRQSERNPEIERLWAYATIEDLQNRIDYLGEDADSRQAIVDIATEYGLVTDYTSMVVVREEVFQQYGIQRNNQQRVATEQNARQQRAAAPVRNNRVDQKQPAFGNPRSSPSLGGGAMGPWILLVLLPLLAARKRRLA